MKKLPPDEARVLLRMIGLSYSKLAELTGKSEITVRRVVLEEAGGYYTKETAKKVWAVIDEYKKTAEKKLAQLKRAA